MNVASKESCPCLGSGGKEALCARIFDTSVHRLIRIQIQYFTLLCKASHMLNGAISIAIIKKWQAGVIIITILSQDYKHIFFPSLEKSYQCLGRSFVFKIWGRLRPLSYMSHFFPLLFCVALQISLGVDGFLFLMFRSFLASPPSKLSGRGRFSKREGGGKGCKVHFYNVFKVHNFNYISIKFQFKGTVDHLPSWIQPLQKENWESGTSFPANKCKRHQSLGAPSHFICASDEMKCVSAPKRMTFNKICCKTNYAHDVWPLDGSIAQLGLVFT